MNIIWDEPKRQINLAKHGLDFAALTVYPAKDGRLLDWRTQRTDRRCSRVHAPLIGSDLCRLDAPRKQKGKEPVMTIKFSSKRPLTDKEEAEIQKMIASDPDNPEITDEQAKQGKPFKDAL